MKAQAVSHAAPGPGISGRGAHFLRALDPRLKVVLAAGFGLLCWRAGWTGLAAYGAGVVFLALRLRAFRPENTRAFRGALLFVFFWALFKLGVEVWQGAPLWPVAVQESGIMAARLGVLVLIGLCLALSGSARQMGLALTWFLRPVLGKRAWKAALALALMIHFLPLALESGSQARTAMRLRNVRGSRARRMALVAKAVLRNMGRKTWTQTVALASRGLDREEAWRPSFRPQPVAWAVGAVLLAAGYGVALV